MIRATLLTGAAALALLSGCQTPVAAAPAHSAAAPARPAAAVARGAAALPSPARVAGMLLTAGDVPAGFRTTAAGTDQSGPDSDGAVQGCGADAEVPHVDGAVVFNRGWSAFIAEGVRVSTAADASRAVRALRDGQCGIKPGSGMTLSRPAFPVLGDESAMLRSRGDALVTRVVTDVVAIRHRDTLIVLTHTVLGEPDTATTQAVARAALARVVAGR